jgi:hypothetical protein
MSKSLIRKNQLHPDVADLISGFGNDFFITQSELEQALLGLETDFSFENLVYTTGNQTVDGIKNFNIRPQVNGANVLIQGDTNVVYTTGNQTINGVKSFGSRPNVNGSGVLLQGEAAASTVENVVYTTGNQTINGVKSFTSLPNVNGIPLSTGFGGGSEFTFPSNLSVILGAGKTFGKYQNGDTIEAAGLTTSQVIQLAITEKINPTVNLSVSPSSILLGQTSISNQLTFSRTINNPGATVTSVSLDWKRSNTSTLTNLSTDINLSSPYTHAFTNTSSNSNGIDYRYIVIDSQLSSGIATANVSFLHGNYFGYSSATSLTTIGQIETLGNQVLSDSRSRTVNSVTAGVNLYTYYAYRADAGDLTSIIQDGAAPVLGAFTKQSDIVGTNTNGASVTYRVYRSNATQAFTNNTLAFS